MVGKFCVKFAPLSRWNPLQVCFARSFSLASTRRQRRMPESFVAIPFRLRSLNRHLGISMGCYHWSRRSFPCVLHTSTMTFYGPFFGRPHLLLATMRFLCG